MIQRLTTGGILRRPSPDHPGGSVAGYAGALSMFFDANGEKQVLDLDTVWRRQAVTEALQRALLLAAAEAHDVITHPPSGVRNMSEWAKQQACWNGLRGRKLAYDEDFDSCLTLAETARSTRRAARATEVMTEGINAQTEAVNLGADFWSAVMAWGGSERKLTPKDMQILQVCTSIPRRIPTDSQAKHAMDLLARLKDQGFNAASSLS